MAAYQAVHRTILVFDIEQSNHPLRTNHDRLVIREAMYTAVRAVLRRLKYYHEDRGDGVLVLVPPEVPKGRLASSLLVRMEAALTTHNAAMEHQNAAQAAATQVRLRVALHAGEVAFDSHGVVGDGWIPAPARVSPAAAVASVTCAALNAARCRALR